MAKVLFSTRRIPNRLTKIVDDDGQDVGTFDNVTGKLVDLKLGELGVFEVRSLARTLLELTGEHLSERT